MCVCERECVCVCERVRRERENVYHLRLRGEHVFGGAVGRVQVDRQTFRVVFALILRSK